MARLAAASASDSTSGYRFYIVVVFDGFGTTADITVMSCLSALADRVRTSKCLISILLGSDETYAFKTRQNIKGMTGPLLFLSEEDPFSGHVDQRALLELGRLREGDDIRLVMAAVAEQAHEDNFVSQARRGERLRRLQSLLAKYGDRITGVLSLLGF
jgi:hypothetical protein